MDAEEEASALNGYLSSPDAEARRLCELVLKMAPDDAAANGLFARALVAEGRREEAIAGLERAASLRDAHSNLVLGYYHFLWRESDRFKGIRFLQQAEALDSSEATLALGKAYETGFLNRPGYHSAATYYEKASNIGMPEATYRLGQSVRLGPWGEAKYRTS